MRHIGDLKWHREDRSGYWVLDRWTRFDDLGGLEAWDTAGYMIERGTRDKGLIILRGPGWETRQEFRSVRAAKAEAERLAREER